MSENNYKKSTIGDHKLKPESLMMSYGYDPKLSEGSVKPPVFLTSTFTFNSAEDGEEFFNVMSGRKEAKNGVDYDAVIIDDPETMNKRGFISTKTIKLVKFK